MFMPKTLSTAALLAFVLGVGALRADGPGLGQPISEAEVGKWNITVLGDGTGLPPGSGMAAQGAKIYAEKCAACHGDNGKGGRNAALVGSPPLDRIEAPKTIANFWGYPTTVFDFTRRAMPWMQPRTLTDDEVYALTAYIFAENKLIGADEVMNAQSLPKVKMPNAANFIMRFPDRMP